MENKQTTLKNIEVVAAIIKRGNAVLATQRGYGDFAGQWEFPGGKIEAGESHETALIREIEEELKTDITVDSFVTTVDYDYDSFHLIMHCYLCSANNEEITLVEHKSAKWLDKTNLESVSWLPADQPVVEIIKNRLTL